MITYTVGDATEPVDVEMFGEKIIVHCCNNIGAWGAGFVLALSKKWPETETWYRHDTRTRGLHLGAVHFVSVENDIVVANLVGQHGVVERGIKRPVRYDAISEGFDKVAHRAIKNESSVHMPRIGCGLAGGDWRIIEALIDESFIAHDIPVTVYDYLETS